MKLENFLQTLCLRQVSRFVDPVDFVDEAGSGKILTAPKNGKYRICPALFGKKNIHIFRKPQRRKNMWIMWTISASGDNPR